MGLLSYQRNNQIKVAQYQYLALARTVGTSSTRFIYSSPSHRQVVQVQQQSSAAVPTAQASCLHGPRTPVEAAKAGAGKLLRATKRGPEWTTEARAPSACYDGEPCPRT
jgi:hypothetical protein